MTVHTLSRFDDELAQLKERVLSMGGLVERAIDNAVKSMLEQNEKLARKTIHRDEAINTLEVKCDDITRSILVRRQPAANDLRFIIATIKIVTDLERMGNLAVDLAENTLQVLEHPPVDFSHLETMGNQVQQQVNHALDALSHGDIQIAMSVIEKDKKVDKFCKSMRREMITYMLEDPHAISTSISLSDAAGNLERIGDHAANIAEMVIYNIQGHDIRHVNHKDAVKMLHGNG